jgi:phage shock protein E
MEHLIQLIKKEDTTIIDVREPWEYEDEHFPGAINIPLSYIPLKLSAMREMPKPILLYCRSGNRSGMAATMLKSAGISDAINVGGLDDIQILSKKYA